MINDNALSDRLNLFREGQIGDLDTNHYDETVDSKTVSLLAIFFKVIELGVVFVRSLTYGFAVKTIFSTDWRFMAFLAVGFSIDLLVTNLTSVLNRGDR